MDTNNFQDIPNIIEWNILSKSSNILLKSCKLISLDNFNLIDSVVWDFKKVDLWYIFVVIFEYSNYNTNEHPLRNAIIYYKYVDGSTFQFSRTCSVFDLTFYSYLWSYPMINGRINSELVNVKYNINFVTLISRKLKTYTISTYLLTGGIKSIE